MLLSSGEALTSELGRIKFNTLCASLDVHSYAKSDMQAAEYRITLICAKGVAVPLSCVGPYL